MSKARTIVGWVSVILLAGAFSMAAIGKLSGAATPMFEAWGYAPWFMMLTGVLELLGAIGLLVPKTSRYAILGLSGLMLGAAYTHLSHAETDQVIRPIIFLLVLGVAWWARGGSSASAEG